MTAIFKNTIFWIVIGASLALAFALLQDRSLKKITKDNAERMLSTTMAYSAFRIAISVGILFLAFRTGFGNGLGCLIAFIIARWIWLILIVKKNNKNSKGEM
jgi:hypothetical protein